MSSNKRIETNTFLKNGIIVLHISDGKIISQHETLIEDTKIGENIYKLLSDMLHWICLGVAYTERGQKRGK